MEDDLWWKTTFDWRRTLIKDNLMWKTTFYGRLLSMEYDLWWKTTFDGRQLSMEDDFWWKTTFEERRPVLSQLAREKVVFSSLRWIHCRLPGHLCQKLTKITRRNLSKNSCLWLLPGFDLSVLNLINEKGTDPFPLPGGSTVPLLPVRWFFRSRLE